MLKLPKTFLLISFFCFALGINVFSQEKENLMRPKPEKKNIIKINLTSGLLYDLPLLVEYERLLRSHQSITIQAGYSKLPFETNTDSLRWTNDLQSSGYNITVDYRFYLRKENKDPAPHGIYLAPFASYFHFSNDRDLEFSEDSAVVPLNVKSKYDFISVGGALGYQFTFGKRWVLDCLLLGPSVTYYNVKMNLSGDLSESELNDIARGMLEALSSHFPFINKLMEDEIASFTGHASSWNYGFRYSIHVGYRF